MTTELLADNTDILPTLVDWYEREWMTYCGVDGPGDAHVDLASRYNRVAIPIGFVVRENDQLAGVAALNIHAATRLTPSVVGLLVTDEFRRRGGASRLLKSATPLAEGLGYKQACISTTVLGDHLLRNGWRWIGNALFLNDEHGSIFDFELQALGQQDPPMAERGRSDGAIPAPLTVRFR